MTNWSRSLRSLRILQYKWIDDVIACSELIGAHLIKRSSAIRDCRLQRKNVAPSLCFQLNCKTTTMTMQNQCKNLTLCNYTLAAVIIPRYADLMMTAIEAEPVFSSTFASYSNAIDEHFANYNASYGQPIHKNQFWGHSLVPWYHHFFQLTPKTIPNEEVLTSHEELLCVYIKRLRLIDQKSMAKRIQFNCRCQPKVHSSFTNTTRVKTQPLKCHCGHLMACSMHVMHMQMGKSPKESTSQ